VSQRTDKLALFQHHRTTLVEYALPMVGSRDQAEDVVQDAWLRFAGTDASSLKQPASYLYRIVRNLAVDTTRRQEREARHARDEGEQPERMAASAERTAAGEQALECALRALDDLPHPTRGVFELYRFEGLTLQQSADRYGISVAAAHRRVRSALLHVHQRLQRLETASQEIDGANDA